LTDVQKRRRKTFGNSEEAAQTTPPSDASNTTFIKTSPAAETDEDDNMTDDDFTNDPDWVSGQTPGGPQRASTLRNKVRLVTMFDINHSWQAGVRSRLLRVCQ